MSLVSHCCHREMHLFRMREQTGSYRIQSDRQLPENPSQCFGGEAVRGEIDQRIDDLASFDIGAELVVRILGEQLAKHR